MDPLSVTGRIRKSIDPVLIHLQPLADQHFLSDSPA
jgi:hypothetical protein